MPRQGPGDSLSTRKAFLLLKNLPEKPAILDIGCGPGMQTMDIARLTDGSITALDYFQIYLDELKEKVSKAGLSKRITLVQGDMNNLDFKNGSFDVHGRA
jgi:ubiquinone/menaquinone biosynthesis C-methylase UbiE